MPPAPPLSQRENLKISVERLDHVAVTVSSLDTACDFYRRVLGMEPVRLPGERRALRFGRHTLHLRVAGDEREPCARHGSPGSADICFVTPVPLDELSPHLAACGVRIVEGPVERPGGEGMLVSIYIHDPDGNLIELANEIASVKVL